jgi:hypothetical protein
MPSESWTGSRTPRSLRRPTDAPYVAGGPAPRRGGLLPLAGGRSTAQTQDFPSRSMSSSRPRPGGPNQPIVILRAPRRRAAGDRRASGPCPRTGRRRRRALRRTTPTTREVSRSQARPGSSWRASPRGSSGARDRRPGCGARSLYPELLEQRAPRSRLRSSPPLAPSVSASARWSGAARAVRGAARGSRGAARPPVAQRVPARRALRGACATAARPRRPATRAQGRLDEQLHG